MLFFAGHVVQDRSKSFVCLLIDSDGLHASDPSLMMIFTFSDGIAGDKGGHQGQALHQNRAGPAWLSNTDFIEGLISRTANEFDYEEVHGSSKERVILSKGCD
jgi:hypothetical protein